MCPLLQLAIRLIQETLGGHDAALVGALADLAGLIIRGDLEGDDLSVHSGDLRLSPDLQAHRGGGHMGDVQLCAYGGLVLAHAFGNGFAGGTLHQGYHAGRGVDQQATGAYLCGGILSFDQGGNLGLHSNGDLHVQTSLFCWVQYSPNRRLCQERD